MLERIGRDRSAKFFIEFKVDPAVFVVYRFNEFAECGRHYPVNLSRLGTPAHLAGEVGQVIIHQGPVVELVVTK